MDFWEIVKGLTDAESIIKLGGTALLLAIVFAENGLIIGFFLPGDSLIFLTGLFCATKPEALGLDITTLTLSMYGAAVAGSLFGYLFGLKLGPAVFNRNDSVIFKKKYVDVTRVFYEKHGGKTLILGRFLPIIRTFAPILAGVIRVDFKGFMIFNLIGGGLWVGSLSFIGYGLGKYYPGLGEYIEHIVIGFFCITTIIVLRSYFKSKKELEERRRLEKEQNEQQL